MKRPVFILAITLLVASAFSVGRWCGPAPELARDLAAVRTELTATRDTLRSGIAAWEGFLAADTLPRQADRQLARADSLHRRRAHHTAPALPPADTASDALQWWKDRADTLEVWMAAANEEAGLARSAAESYRSAHRQAVEAASWLYVAAMVSEGRLNMLLPKVEEAEQKAASLERAASRAKRPLAFGIAADLIVAGDRFASVAGVTVELKKDLWIARLTIQGTAGVGAAGSVLTGEVVTDPAGSVRVAGVIPL